MDENKYTFISILEETNIPQENLESKESDNFKTPVEVVNVIDIDVIPTPIVEETNIPQEILESKESDDFKTPVEVVNVIDIDVIPTPIVEETNIPQEILESKESDDFKTPIEEPNCFKTLNTTSMAHVNLIDIIVKNEGISSITLSNNELNLIYEIMSVNPLYFKNINDELLEIIKDKKIDVYDTPRLIQLIKQFYIFCKEDPIIKNNVKLSYSEIFVLIKYSIHIILHVHKVDSPEIITCCDNLVDICMELIEIKSPLKKTLCIFNKLFNWM
jgi:hypothetical protein